MKNIIVLFLFFSSVVFSQNYYPLDKASVPDTENPSIPLNLVASNVTQTTVDLSWTPATDNVAVTNYRIYNDGNLLVASTGNVTSYTLTGLNANTAYNLTIRALDAAGNESNDSNNTNFTTNAIITPDTENPSIPLDLIANNITQTTVDLSWIPAIDNVAVTNYRIYNDGNLLVASTGNVTSYSVSGLNSNTTYNLTVRAIDAAGNESNDSNNVVFTTSAIVTPDTENPSIPLDLIANNITQTTADLSWTAATDNVAVTNYRVYNNGNLLINSTGNVTSYNLTGLNSKTNYNLTIRAIDAANNESNDSNNQAFTTNAIFTTDTENPTAPTNLVANNITQTTADLSWTAATDNVAVTNYRIYNNGNLLINSTGNVTNYNLTGLNSETNYNLTIRAIDAANNESGDSNNANFNTAAIVTPDTENPSIPLNLVASNVTQTTVDLSWTPATDNVAVTNYRIYNNGNLLINSTGNVTNYNLTGLNAETNYNLTIRAIDAANNESNDSNNQAFTTNAIFTPDTENPTAPNNLIASNVTQTTVDLSWSAATDNVAVTNYRVYNNGNLLINSTGNVTSYNLTGLNSETNYNLTIRAIDAANNESNDSNNQAFTTGAIFTPDTENPTAPTNLVANNITQTTADLSWTAATDNVAVTNYRVYNNGNILINSTGNVTSYNLTGLNSETNYNLTIRAIDAANNESNDSNNQAFTTGAIFTPDTENPTAPTNLVANNITQTTADLSWTAATDNVAVTNYRIYNNGNLLINSTGNVTNYNLTGLNSETNYNLTIRAIDAANNESNDSNNQAFTTGAIFTPDTENPTAPNNLIASNVTQTTVDLSWSAATDNVAVTNYRIYNNGNLLINSTGNVTSYNLTGLNAETNYNLTIRAIDAANNESNDSNVINFTTEVLDKEAPTAPLNLVATNITQTSANLSWADATDNVEVVDYIIYNNGEILVSSTSNVTNYRLTGLTDNTSYNITIRAIDEANNQSADSNTESFNTTEYTGTENMPHEIAYYDAHYLPASQASTLQNALNTYGAVRLGEGDYTASGTITMSSNQRLYGWIKQNGTKLGGDINIAAGSTNVHIEDIEAENEIRFEAGSPITNSIIKSVYYSEIECINCQMENNTFIDLNRVTVELDCSSSGYFRNNTWIRVFAQSTNNHVKMVGNNTTPSYGNVELSRNLLNSSLSTSEYRNIDNHTLVGSDAEYWNNNSQPANAAWYFRDIGTLKFFNSFGYSTPPSFNASEFDIEADKILMGRRAIGSSRTPRIQAGSDLLYIEGDKRKPDLIGDAWAFFGHHDGNATDINGKDISNTVTGTDAERLNNLIFDTKYTPFLRPNLPTLPNPTGSTWSADRQGQADQSAEIQALINANGVALLDEGIYYISKPLFIKNRQGIVGKGTGKTAIVGITDDFPLIIAQDDVSGGRLTNVTYPLAYLTLQGGSKGLHIDPIGKNLEYLQITSWNIKNVVFRDQDYGIHFDQFYAMDNTFINCVNFVNCNKAIFQDPLKPNPNGGGEYAQNMYIDKSLFYECQYINNTVALDMNPENARPNNLNAWVNCLFEGNDIVMNSAWSNAIYMANSDIINNKGNYLFVGTAPMEFYSCNFSGNSSSALFDKGVIYAEGCNFNDAINFFNGSNKELYLWNSKVNSSISTNDIKQGYIINSNISGNTTLSKPMVEVINGNALTILDGVVNPYPQLLVKQ